LTAQVNALKKKGSKYTQEEYMARNKLRDAINRVGRGEELHRESAKPGAGSLTKLIG